MKRIIRDSVAGAAGGLFAVAGLRSVNAQDDDVAAAGNGGTAIADASGGDNNVAVNGSAGNGGSTSTTGSAGNGGAANASANGGAVSLGDVNSGGNSGNVISVGDTVAGPGPAPAPVPVPEKPGKPVPGKPGKPGIVTITPKGGKKVEELPSTGAGPLAAGFDSAALLAGAAGAGLLGIGLGLGLKLDLAPALLATTRRREN